MKMDLVTLLSLKLTTNIFSTSTSSQGDSFWHWALIPVISPVGTRVRTLIRNAFTRIDATVKPVEWSR